jgi:hypothetical protein
MTGTGEFRFPKGRVSDLFRRKNMAEKNPLDDIVDELVVFKHEDPNHPDGEYFSNNPMWNDSRVREHWMKRHADDDTVEDEDDDTIEDEDGDNYEEWKNDDLRAELVTRGLSVEGTKKELVARLRKNDDENQG